MVIRKIPKELLGITKKFLRETEDILGILRKLTITNYIYYNYIIYIILYIIYYNYIITSNSLGINRCVQ